MIPCLAESRLASPVCQLAELVLPLAELGVPVRFHNLQQAEILLLGPYWLFHPGGQAFHLTICYRQAVHQALGLKTPEPNSLDFHLPCPFAFRSKYPAQISTFLAYLNPALKLGRFILQEGTRAVLLFEMPVSSQGLQLELLQEIISQLLMTFQRVVPLMLRLASGRMDLESALARLFQPEALRAAAISAPVSQNSRILCSA